MNKKYFISVAFAVVIATTGYFGYKSDYQQKKLSALQLANIEALSTPELPVEKLRDEYCERFDDYICTVYWKVGNGAVNSTSFLDYWSW